MYKRVFYVCVLECVRMLWLIMDGQVSKARWFCVFVLLGFGQGLMLCDSICGLVLVIDFSRVRNFCF